MMPNVAHPAAAPGIRRASRRRIGVILMTSLLVGSAATPAVAATTLPVVWTAGGLSAGIDSAGQAARITSDTSGNVAVVSGPSDGLQLLVTSYTATGSLRWRRAVSPSLGTFVGDWVVSALDGDLIAVGHNVTSRGNPIAITMVRYAPDGTLRWRLDLARTLPSVARLLVDAAGNAYLAFSSVGDGQDMQLHKYNTAGVLIWAQVVSTGSFANDIATSLALSPDETDVVMTGNIVGGASWITAAYNATTGARKWLVTAAEGTATRAVVVDATRVYVAGQGTTGAGTPGITNFLTAIAYDRTTGARLWRTDKKPADGYDAAGLRMALAPDGSIVVAGQANRGFLDWYTVALETTGAVRWEAVRDGGLNTNEIPASVLVTPDGTTVVTGPGGPNLPGGYIPGVTAGYGPDGTLLWEAFARLATVWATALPNGDVCATGGYDALITCWRVSGGAANQSPTAVMSATPATGVAPLTVSFDGTGSSDPDGTISSWSWSFGDGTSSSGTMTSHTYTTSGTFTARLTVADNGGALGTTTVSIVVSVPADTVAITLAQYRASKRQLSVQATSTAAGATLTAYVTATGERIGTLTDTGGGKLSGKFTWPNNPQNITVRSSLGGSATRAVTTR